MRYVSAALRAVLDSRRRRPDYKLYAWDPRTVSMSQIVSAPSHLDSSLPEPLDLTPFATEIAWSEKQLSFTIVDPANLFHPDTGAYRGYLRDGAIVRLVEGDETVVEAEWITTFTGQVHGQVGWKKARNSQSLQSRVNIFGRGDTPAFRRRKITSKEYSVGTDLGTPLYDIAYTFMGLSTPEIRIPFALGRQLKHTTNQLVQVTPWEGISALLEVVCYLPYFDGEGKLTYVNKNLQRTPDKILADYVSFVENEVPERSQDAVNKVKVIFLDSQLERVDSPYQTLGTAQVTTGFFSSGEELECWWSEDHKQRASDTHMKVIKSVNSGLLPVGSESYQENDEFHGTIRVEISVWVPIVATVALIELLVAAAFPDLTEGGQPVTTAGFIGSAGITLPFGITLSWGRIIEAQALITIMLIMMSIGSAQYEVWGTPYDMAYLEKQSIAIKDGLDYWLENEMEIKNDFIGTHDQADTIAVTELIYQTVLGQPRKIVIEDDPALEVGDIVVLPDGRKVLITTMSKRIRRGEVPSLTIEGGKVMLG